MALEDHDFVGEFCLKLFGWRAIRRGARRNDVKFGALPFRGCAEILAHNRPQVLSVPVFLHSALKVRTPQS
jgi:hypothetical protein